MCNFSIGDSVIVFKGYGKESYISKIVKDLGYQYELEDGTKFSEYSNRSSDIDVFLYDAEKHDNFLRLHRIRKIIYALYFNKNAQSNIDENTLKILENLISEKDFENTVSAGYSMGSLTREDKFIYEKFKKNS